MELFALVMDVAYFVILWFMLLIQAFYAAKYSYAVYRNACDEVLKYYEKALKYNGATLFTFILFGLIFVVPK